MQIQGGSPKGVLSSREKSTLKREDQLHQQRVLYQRVFLLRSLQGWWYRIALAILAGIIAGFLGRFALISPLAVIGGIIMLPLCVLFVRRLEVGLLFTAIFATPFLPKAFSLKSLDIYPAAVTVLLLFIAVLLRTVFRAPRSIWPSFWVIWPQFGLIVLAVISDIMIQVTWIPEVPRQINNNPVILNDMLGIVIYLFPLMTIVVTTVALTKRSQWIEYIQITLVILSMIASFVIMIDFVRLGANLYTFRFIEQNVGWMSLRSLAQLYCLGAIIAYGRFLYASHLHKRLFYIGAVVLCLVSVGITLQNSWWSEVGVALVVMTIVYSPRLFLSICAIALPFVPLLSGQVTKLLSVKSDDYYRFIIWGDFLRVWSKRPWLGVGPGNAWGYDQVYTMLPPLIRDFNKTGLGVAHNGYIQTLTELGPIGLFFLIASIIVIAVAATRLYRRSNTQETCTDRVLGLIALGLICGSVVGDYTSGSLFLPARQVGMVNEIPSVLTSWILFGCVLYKDQLWRLTRKRLSIEESL